MRVLPKIRKGFCLRFAQEDGKSSGIFRPIKVFILLALLMVLLAALTFFCIVVYVRNKDLRIKFELKDSDRMDRSNSETCDLSAERKSEKMLCPGEVKELHFFNLRNYFFHFCSRPVYP
jgi:hypothetical protein